MASELGNRVTKWLSRNFHVNQRHLETIRYQHKPFEDDRSIRLLYLQPGKFDDDIKLRLKTVSLDNPPRYCALSYAWGPQPHEGPVYCDGKQIMVSENCVAALRRLRDRYRKKTLWIDAICIDQASLQERGHQVKLMCDVYSKAERTWIWMGESTEESDFMMDFLEGYCKILDAINLSAEDQDELLRLGIEKLKAEERRLYGTQSTALIESLCDRPWFDRVWTVQEYTLSRDPQAMCGCKILPMSRIFDGLWSIQVKRVKNGELDYIATTDQFLAYRSEFADIWNVINGNGKKPILLSDLLAEARDLRSSDPKDAVFGLYGMLEKLQISVPPPDYTKSVVEIYTEATKTAIENDSSLDILLQCSGAETLTQLPSWVPDWSSPRKNGLGSSFGVGDDFKASGRSCASFYFLDDCESVHERHEILCVKGISIDVLNYCAPEMYLAHEIGRELDAENQTHENLQPRLVSELHAIVAAWRAAISKLSQYPTGENALQAFSRTVILDQSRFPLFQNLYPSLNVLKGSTQWHHSQLAGSPQIGESDDEYENRLTEAFEEDFLEQAGRKTTENNKTSETKYVPRSLEITEDAAAFQHMASIYSRNTRFFTTEKGYMGLGMPVVHIGDEVILVTGVSIPLIAQKVGGRYRLLGPAYVHGVMDGEKWPENESELVDIMFQ